MLNIKNFDDFINCTVDKTKEIINNKLSNKKISFKNIDNFSTKNGLYFIFLNEIVLYIGKADKQNIQTRCRQYLNKSSGGTLRKKIECIKECNSDVAIEYVKTNLSAKFVEIDTIDNIPMIEEISIWAFQPKLNVIKPTDFSYQKLSF